MPLNTSVAFIVVLAKASSYVKLKLRDIFPYFKAESQTIIVTFALLAKNRSENSTT